MDIKPYLTLLIIPIPFGLFLVAYRPTSFCLPYLNLPYTSKIVSFNAIIFTTPSLSSNAAVHLAGFSYQDVNYYLLTEISRA